MTRPSSYAAGALIMPRKLTLGVLYTAAGLLAGGAAWGAVYTLKVDRLEQQDRATEILINRRIELNNAKWDAAGKDRERIIRLEEKVDGVNHVLRRIEDKLDRR